MKRLLSYTKPISLLLLALLVVVGCETDEPVVPAPGDTGPPTAGDLDFSTYVSIGASFTAGFTDGVLWRTGQENSYPAIMAQAFDPFVSGGITFNQPLMEAPTAPNAIGVGPGAGAFNPPNGRFLFANIGGSFPVVIDQGSIGPQYSLADIGNPASSWQYNPAARSTLQNLGVPGIPAGGVLVPDMGNPSSGNFNPYYNRFAPDPGVYTKSIIDFVTDRNPTFVSIMLGGNDVLGAALAGDSLGMTDALTFGGIMSTVIDSIISNTTADGVVANVPDVTDLPFFNTVPGNLSVVSDAPTAAAVNGGWDNDTLRSIMAGQYGVTVSVVGSADLPYRTVGANPLIIEADNGVIREIRPGELILFPALTNVGSGQGTDPTFGFAGSSYTSPPFIPDNQVLDEGELAAIRARIDAYNATIASLVAANSSRLKLVDLFTELKLVAEEGTPFGDASIPYGDLFGADGIHPTPRGYAVLANIYIQYINLGFGVNIPGVDPLQYAGNSVIIP